MRPDTKITGLNVEKAKEGHIYVDEFMRTSDPNIYAVGDCIMTKDALFPEKNIWTPLGGPANRQGRIAATHIVDPKNPFLIPYKGSLGTAIVKFGDAVAGVVGYNEKKLKQEKIKYESVVVQGMHHASYYPGAMPLTMKLLFCPDTGKIFGAQAFGIEGVDKRLDVISTAIRLIVHKMVNRQRWNESVGII